MAYSATNGRIGSQPIANTAATAAHPLGTILCATDPTYGEGEFIYLVGVAATTIGSAVTWNFTTHQTALLPATAATGAPVAISMSANLAAGFGWYQIKGVAVFAKTVVSGITDIDGAAVYISATAGLLGASITSGMQIINAQTANLATVATATTTGTVVIDRPAVQSVA